MKTQKRYHVFSRYLAASSIMATLLLLGGCGEQDQETDQGTSMKSLSGTVTYRERMMIPPESELHVTLEDVSKQDVPSEVISESISKTDGAPPYSFVLDYDESKIAKRGRYAIRAKITFGERLYFTSTEFIPAFDDSRDGPLEIVLSRAQPLASLVNTRWKVLFINNAPATLGAGERELFFTLNETDSSVSGFSGCNKIVGGFEYDESNLNFTQLASTQMACPDGMEQEKRMLEALRSVSTYKISGNHLTVSDESGTPLLRCEALYLQ